MMEYVVSNGKGYFKGLTKNKKYKVIQIRALEDLQEIDNCNYNPSYRSFRIVIAINNTVISLTNDYFKSSDELRSENIKKILSM